MYQTPEDRPIYRLLTGKDDRAFCERVSEALAPYRARLKGAPVPLTLQAEIAAN